jgi:putative nucleotidyltransferase with HDIG domain
VTQPSEAHAAELDGSRWRPRARLGIAVSLAAFVLPLLAAVGVASLLAQVIARPDGTGRVILWWLGILASSMVAMGIVELLSRRLLPLAALLKMTMLFPDRAPSRLAVARRAGSTRELARRTHEREGGGSREPIEVAAGILALAAALSRHDRKTRGHSERVRAFTDLLADELELSPADRDRLRWSSLLHDVGKMSVHADVLNKHGSLTAAEWDELKRHPLEGARIIEPLRAWLGPWALTVEQHHERFDGTGYPFGLSGDAISLGARIVSVADSFEVMTAGRSYQRSMSPLMAREELTRCAGGQFDPDVVRAFLNISIGKIRWVMGPLSWLADVPVAARLSNATHALAMSSQATLAATALAASTVAAGTVSSHAPSLTPPNTAAGLPVATTLSAWPNRSAGSVGSKPDTVSGSAATTTPPDRDRSKRRTAHRARPAPRAHAPRVTVRNPPMPAPSSPPQAMTTTTVSAPSTTSTSAPSSTTTTTTTTTTAPPTPTPLPTSPTTTSTTPGVTITTVRATTTTHAPTTTTSSSSTTTTTTTVGVTTSPPPATNGGQLVVRNGSGVAGRPDSGDQIVVTYVDSPSAGDFCDGWSGTSTLTGPTVVVTGTEAQSGDDEIEASDSECLGGFNFGTIDLGQNGYFRGSVTFGD